VAAAVGETPGDQEMRMDDSMALKDILADWRDYDDAAFRLGILLGVFPPDQTFSPVKRVFWVDGYPLGEMLVDILDRMARVGREAAR
jgi:hypothetical protein